MSLYKAFFIAKLRKIIVWNIGSSQLQLLAFLMVDVKEKHYVKGLQNALKLW